MVILPANMFHVAGTEAIRRKTEDQFHEIFILVFLAVSFRRLILAVVKHAQTCFSAGLRCPVRRK